LSVLSGPGLRARFELRRGQRFTISSAKHRPRPNYQHTSKESLPVEMPSQQSVHRPQLNRTRSPGTGKLCHVRVIHEPEGGASGNGRLSGWRLCLSSRPKVVAAPASSRGDQWLGERA
jgi:hypothetical protein